MSYEDFINRHQRIALQFSGGKDSLACLYLMRDWWDRMTVYWLNTGNAYPETVKLATQVRDMVPHFVEIESNQPAVIANFGLPSDIVPVSSTPFGVFASGEDRPIIQDRYSCCARTIMLPMHQRMIDDGITLIIRGQRNDDKVKAPISSGYIENSIEYMLPIEDWSSRQVLKFLEEQEAPIPRFYELLDEAPDCMTCSAWWEKGSAEYLKRYHYPEYQEVQRRLDTINQAVAGHISNFNKEVSL